MYENDVNVLMKKLLSEDSEQMLNKLRQPLPANLLRERESFSNPLFALKIKILKNNTKRKNSNRYGRVLNFKKIEQEIKKVNNKKRWYDGK